MRTVRELEPPSADEGWDAVEVVPFARTGGSGRPGVFVAAAAADRFESPDRSAPHLVFDWRPDEDTAPLQAVVDVLSSKVTGPVDAAVCPHGGGPPKCWCRPPLPGLPLAFARAYTVDVSRSTFVGCRPAHKALAEALGGVYIDASDR
jgi:hypothetical protein